MIILLKFHINEPLSQFLEYFKKQFPENLQFPQMSGVDSLQYITDDPKKYDEEFSRFYGDDVYMEFFVNLASELNLITNFIVKNFQNRNVNLSIQTNEIPIDKTNIKKALSLEYENVKNRKYGRIDGRKPPEDIPYSKIPAGIIFSIENSLRLLDDAILLAENARFLNSIVNTILSTEEFAKCILLLEYYVDKKKVPASKINQFFGNHHYRLSEIERFREEIIHGNLPNSFQYTFMGITAQNKIFHRMLYTYVDWHGDWSNPNSREPLLYDYTPDRTLDEAFLIEFLGGATELLDNLKLIVSSEIMSKICDSN